MSRALLVFCVSLLFNRDSNSITNKAMSLCPSFKVKIDESLSFSPSFHNAQELVSEIIREFRRRE